MILFNINTCFVIWMTGLNALDVQQLLMTQQLLKNFTKNQIKSRQQTFVIGAILGRNSRVNAGVPNDTDEGSVPLK